LPDLSSRIVQDANKAKVKMLGGLRMLLNILQTKKNADFKLQMAAGAALFNICDGDGTSLSLILEYVRSYILLPSNNPPSTDELPEKVKEVLNKAKSTLRPEREIRKLVDLVDGSQTVASTSPSLCVCPHGADAMAFWGSHRLATHHATLRSAAGEEGAQHHGPVHYARRAAEPGPQGRSQGRPPLGEPHRAFRP
jgi:hypothetical protein